MADCDCPYCTHVRGNPDRANDKLETLHQVREALGNRSHMFVRRRIADPRFRFPRVIYLGRAPHVYRSDRVLWQESPHASLTTAFNDGRVGGPGEAA